MKNKLNINGEFKETKSNFCKFQQKWEWKRFNASIFDN